MMMMMMRALFLILTCFLAAAPTSCGAFVVSSPAAFFVAARRQSSAALAMAAIDTSDIKNGMTIELDDGEPYKVLNFSIMKQARGAAKTTIKFKNLMRGNTIENTYRSGEKFETAMIEKTDAQFTYKEGVRACVRACEIAFILLTQCWRQRLVVLWMRQDARR